MQLKKQRLLKMKIQLILRTYNVLKSGSRGNAVIYHDCIMVDCGVPYNTIEPYKNDVSVILLTHEHGDHININTIRRLQEERPALRIGCCEWMIGHLAGLSKIDLLKPDRWYSYGNIVISPFKLKHDVLNCGYRIFKNDNNDYHKIIHATDTRDLDGIKAVDYDVYAIEHNYCEEKIIKNIRLKQNNNQFSYEKGSINSHLSEQQAAGWLFENKKESSIIVRLHESDDNL